MWRSNLGTKLGQHMDWVVFFRQFVYHAAFPASLPLIWLLEGKQALYNQSFIPAGDSSAIKASLFHQLLMYLIPWCAMVLWLADPGAAPGVELLVTVGAWWLRSLMIAVKYGYMDPDVYRRSRACPTSEALTFQARFQLISGWANPVEVQVGLAHSAAAQRGPAPSLRPRAAAGGGGAQGGGADAGTRATPRRFAPQRSQGPLRARSLGSRASPRGSPPTTSHAALHRSTRTGRTSCSTRRAHRRW